MYVKSHGFFSSLSAALALAILVFVPCKSAADQCLADAWDNGTVSGGSPVFPNWSRVRMGAYDLWITSSGSPENLTSLTVVNFGSALGSDISRVYWRAFCDDEDTGFITMTYAGNYAEDSGTYPAWTWNGVSADMSGCYDLCGDPVPCGAYFTLELYADIAPCPTDGATIKLGFPINATNDPLYWGSIYDSEGCIVPWADLTIAMEFPIRYVHKKADKEFAAPGDTISYTLFIGTPGTAPLGSIIVWDSLPPYTHLVSGSASPIADSGYSPKPGPPDLMRWTLPGGPVVGGNTRAVSFSLTVDWGNGEAFEPGSGNKAAPEGERLRNIGAAQWPDAVPCTNFVSFSQPAQTTVRRFLFWKIASNDLLLAHRLGYPDDEMEYEIFVKNLSTKKTWWNMQIYDTVPSGLTVWDSGLGFQDLCLGFTMTPAGGGCSPGNPGRVLSGGNTLLTWMLDLYPQQTASVRWRAKLEEDVEAGSTIINLASILALGATGIVGGTGNSIRPASFTHLATVKLRTTYYSYNSWAAMGDQRGCAGFFISFYPLNRSTVFELRKLECQASNVGCAGGGKSETINTYVGSCLDGFVADFAPGDLSTPGCRDERAPAVYWPGIWNQLICPTYWFNFLYKVTSNSPFLWMAFSETTAPQMDAHTFLPSTSLSYRGFMHYTTMRVCYEQLLVPGYGDRLAVINTSVNYADEFDPDLSTTVHIFRWNPVSIGWDYVKTGFIDPESIWVPLEGTNADAPERVFHHRIISSDAQTLVYQGFHTFNAPSIGGAYDNFGTLAPTRETGNLVSGVGKGTFYFIAQHGSRRPNVVIGNLGEQTATFRIYRYQPLDTTVPGPNWPPTMAGYSGKWLNIATTTVDAGLDPLAINPRVFMGTPFVNPQTYGTPWKVELLSGGPIQIFFGGCVFDSWSGASNLHAKDGKAHGKEFWLHTGPGGGGFGVTCENPETYCVNIFCPKKDMKLSVSSTGGWSASYTTDGPDQVIVWRPITSYNRHAYRFFLAPDSPADGTMIAQYHQCTFDEKFLTAPFVETGVHYEIIAPPVAFVGQEFWITVVVIDAGGSTKTDYAGITSFTSSDPLAQIDFTPMGSPGAEYDWLVGDEGVKLFLGVFMVKLGDQPIVAVDTTDGSISGLTSVRVVGADIKFTKHPPVGVAASGDIVQFKICWSNYSSASAIDFLITDAVPNGVKYLTDPVQSLADHFCGSSSGFPQMYALYSTSNNLPGSYSPIPAGGTTQDVKWLRWSIPVIGVNSTGCVCFKVRVD